MNLYYRSWSDWVSCLHAKVGVPRWLTAATISLGIIFSLWLCLVIPSTAPKRKVKTVFIKGEKPSASLTKAVEVAAKAKAKEAEAAGFNPGDYMVAVINVSGQDLPPTYDGLTTEAGEYKCTLCRLYTKPVFTLQCPPPPPPATGATWPPRPPPWSSLDPPPPHTGASTESSVSVFRLLASAQ